MRSFDSIKNFPNISNIMKIIQKYPQTILLMPVTTPLYMFLFSNTPTNTIATHDRTNQIEQFIYNISKLSSSDTAADVYKLLQSDVGLLFDAFPESQPQEITSVFGAFGINMHTNNYVNIDKFIPRQKAYYLNTLESKYHALLKKREFHVSSIKECKSGLVHGLLANPATWGAKNAGPNKWRIDIPEFQGMHAWADMHVTSITFSCDERVQINETYVYDDADWTVDVAYDETKASRYLNDNPMSKELYVMRIAAQTMSYCNFTIFHSWIHFPYQDFVSVWVSNRIDAGNTDGVLFSIFYTHSINSMWNAKLVKRLGRSTDSQFDPLRKTSSESLFAPGNKHVNMANIGKVFMARAVDTQFEAFSSEAGRLPYIGIQKKAHEATRKFVDSIWPHIRDEANDFIEFVRIYSNETLDFSKDPKAFIARVLWTQSFGHAPDHIALAACCAKHRVMASMMIPEARSEAYSGCDATRSEWIMKRIDDVNSRFDNFMRTFADYTFVPNTTPTLQNFSYDTDNAEVQKHAKQFKTDLLTQHNAMANWLHTTYGDVFDKERYIQCMPTSIDF